MEMLRKAALDGLGIARMPRFLVAAALDSGDLVPVETDLVPLQLPIHAVHLGQKGMRPAVRHLLDWLKGAYQHVC
jgi:DNA-binding transcriptional LysR family regulator